jgi:uncharacterized membrane protein
MSDGAVGVAARGGDAPTRPTAQNAARSLGYWLLQHWLALVNLAAALFAGLPLAAPLLMAAGWHAPALLIYTLYHAACHQWPGRSYFLFGPQVVYSMDELNRAGLGMAREFVGDAAVGFKVAYCERDLAIYTTVLLTGLLYALVRTRARPLPWRVFLLALAPMALDGFPQLFGWHESTWLLRTLTGVLAGFAGVWLLYPRIERAVRVELAGQTAGSGLGSHPRAATPTTSVAGPP